VSEIKLQRFLDAENKARDDELQRFKDAESKELAALRAEQKATRISDKAAEDARLIREHAEREQAILHTRKMEMYSAQSTFSLHMARHNFLPGAGGTTGMFQPANIPAWTQPEALMQYTPSPSDPKMQ